MPTRLYLRKQNIPVNNYILYNFDGITYTFHRIEVNSTNNINILSYSVTGGGAGQYNTQVTTFDINGNFLWRRDYGGSSNENPSDFVLDSSDNIYIAGKTSTPNILFLKYNSSGSIQFQKSIGGGNTAICSAESIAIDSSSSLYLVGNVRFPSGSNPIEDALVVKCDSTGSIIYQKTLGLSLDSNYSSVYDADVDSLDNLYTVSNGGGPGGYITLSKLDKNGNIQWHQFYTGSDVIQPRTVKTDSSDNIYILGYSLTGSLVNSYLVKYNPSGSIIWQRKISFANFRKIDIDPSNNVYINASDSYIIKYDTDGNLLWQRGFSNGFAFDIKHKSNFIYLAAYTSDGLIIKIPDDGSETGSYGVINYTTSSLTSTTATNLSVTRSVGSSTTTTMTVTNLSLTEVAGTYTDSVITTTNYPFKTGSATITASIYAGYGLEQMSLTSGSSQSSLTFNTLASTTRQNVMLGRFISPTLNTAQTVGGGNMILNAAENESNLNVNFWVNGLNAYVWRPSTGQKVGVLRETVTASLGGLEPTSAGSEQVTHITGITTTAISAQAGDVIICEVWGTYIQGMATAYTATWYYNGTTTNTTENAVVSNHASFIEFSENLTFGTPATSSISKTYFMIIS